MAGYSVKKNRERLSQEEADKTAELAFEELFSLAGVSPHKNNKKGEVRGVTVNKVYPTPIDKTKNNIYSESLADVNLQAVKTPIFSQPVAEPEPTPGSLAAILRNAKKQSREINGSAWKDPAEEKAAARLREMKAQGKGEYDSDVLRERILQRQAAKREAQGALTALIDKSKINGNDF